jgi:hypothetical protein
MTAAKQPTPTPEQYAEGAVKQNPDTLAVAVRTAPGLPREWAVMTTDLGGRYTTYDEVEAWVDMQPTPAAKAAARRKT